MPTDSADGGRTGTEAARPPDKAELDLLLALYTIERQNDQSVLNAQLAIIATAITYLTATIAVVVSDVFLPSDGRHWAYALLPLVPTLLFCYLAAFLSDALYRRGYLDSIEERIRKAKVEVPYPPLKSNDGRLPVPYWGVISRDVWAPPRKWRHLPLLATQTYLFAGAFALLLGLMIVVSCQMPARWASVLVLVVYGLPLAAVMWAITNMRKIGKEAPYHLSKELESRDATDCQGSAEAAATPATRSSSPSPGPP